MHRHCHRWTYLGNYNCTTNFISSKVTFITFWNETKEREKNVFLAHILIFFLISEVAHASFKHTHTRKLIIKFMKHLSSSSHSRPISGKKCDVKCIVMSAWGKFIANGFLSRRQQRWLRIDYNFTIIMLIYTLTTGQLWGGGRGNLSNIINL